MGVASDTTRGHSHSKLCDPLALTVLQPPPPVFTEPEEQMYGPDSTGLHFDWLWFSEVVSVCCRESDFDEG